MTMQDPVADMLTRIRNAQAVHNANVSMPSSKLKLAIAQVLRDEGYIGRFSVSEGPKRTLSIDLKYHKGQPVIEVLDPVHALSTSQACDLLENECGVPSADIERVIGETWDQLIEAGLLKEQSFDTGTT